MARNIHRLSARSVSAATKPGRHADGDNLYLVVDKSGAKRWVFLFRWEGRLREMGFGGIARVSLADARAKAVEARRLLAEGRNPIDARREASTSESERQFGPFADALVAELQKGFRNEKHKAQWPSSLRMYASSLRLLSLDDIETDNVLAVLQPIWLSKPETASRLRGRIERILDAAKARGLRSGENPARWRGHLDSLLPKPSKLSRGHHAAMDFNRLPEFMNRLRAVDAIAARALEFCILTAGRSGEVLGAAWDELDLDASIWTVPGERMKSERPHRVPLSADAAEIIAAMAGAKRGEFVFPGRKPGRPLSSMSMAMTLRRLGEGSVTVHGFRSSFRDWAAECTSFPREIAEAALAHTIGDATERAYRRGDALQKRRVLMESWGSFCGELHNRH